MKIYIAARTSAISRVRELIQIAESGRHQITHDWTQKVEAQGGRAERGQYPPEYFRQVAEDDARGVKDCDLLILLWEDNMLGALIETGMAMALGKDIWIVTTDDEAIRFSVFWSLPGVRFIYPFEVGQELTH